MGIIPTLGIMRRLLQKAEVLHTRCGLAHMDISMSNVLVKVRHKKNLHLSSVFCSLFALYLQLAIYSNNMGY